MFNLPKVTSANIIGTALFSYQLFGNKMGWIPLAVLGTLKMNKGYYDQIYTGYKYTGYLNLGLSATITFIDFNLGKNNTHKLESLAKFSLEALEFGVSLYGVNCLSDHFNSNKIDVTNLFVTVISKANDIPEQVKTIAPYAIGAGMAFMRIPLYSITAFKMDKNTYSNAINGWKYSTYFIMYNILFEEPPKSFLELGFKSLLGGIMIAVPTELAAWGNNCIYSYIEDKVDLSGIALAHNHAD
jgi:hypothetical protein